MLHVGAVSIPLAHTADLEGTPRQLPAPMNCLCGLSSVLVWAFAANWPWTARE